jgi:RimJ/RimL family protein N-acetyltransferase
MERSSSGPFTEDDVPAITEACQDPEIPRWTRAPSPYTEEDARAFVAGAAEGSFALVDARTGELLGSIGVRPVGDGIGQIGYWITREARGRCVATRALRMISDWALETLELSPLQLITQQRVAEKAGFQREGSCAPTRSSRVGARTSICTRSCPATWDSPATQNAFRSVTIAASGTDVQPEGRA